MSDYYDSEIGEEEPGILRGEDKESFRYDYYLSNSVDIFKDWKVNHKQYASLEKEQQHLKYLELEFKEVTKVEKFRTADVIRLRGFIHVLKKCFQELQADYQSLFRFEGDRKEKENSKDTKEKGKERENNYNHKDIVQIQGKCKSLEKRLFKLLKYGQVLTDLRMLEYYPIQTPISLELNIATIISKLYTYITDAKLLWQISCAQNQLVEDRFHSISLGGNHLYYKNITRSMLKRNWQLKEIFDRLMLELKSQTFSNMDQSTFIVRMICEVLALDSQKLSEKEKAEFIDSLKGLYYLEIDMRGKGIFYEYLFTSFHLDILSTQNMFRDYNELEELFVRLLESSRHDGKLVALVFSVEIDKLPFDKRSRIPEIEQLIIDMAYNYIGVVKGLFKGLKEERVFSNIKPIPTSECYASSLELLQNENVNALIGLLMCMQESSKDAFSLGDIHVHKIYLQMSEIIKEIYLSYQHQHWLFPSNILLYIPLGYFMEISDDIKADVKKTLFLMVESINQDRMPTKIKWSAEGKKEVVERGEYLQVILYFLEECRQHEEYINLPEIVPSNLETSILYVQSLELKLNNKEPTPEQMPYVKNMLKTCESYKLTIKFKWYENKESIEDREMEFNIEKDLPELWMRRVYRQTINERESQQIKAHYDQYKNNKGLTILNLANIFKYCHGLMPGNEIEKKSIREEDLFVLLEEVKMLLSIKFDIFNLNPDEEISLNYIHVCLGLYNSSYDETPFNQTYLMIMENIMRPYLSHPNSTLTPFRGKYPGFFEKWIYSFQIGAILGELGGYIAEKGEDETCRVDIINKIKLVKELLDNRENISKTITIEELTETIVVFSTLINRQAEPLVYIESVELFALFLNSFPEVKKDVSLDFMLDCDLFSNQKLVDQMVTYIKKSERPYMRDEVSILNSMMEHLVTYMGAIGLKRTNSILELYSSKVEHVFDEVLQTLEEKLYKIPEKEVGFMVNVVRLIFTLKRQFQCEKQGKASREDFGVKIQIIHDSLLQQDGKVEEVLKGDFHFCDLVFIEDVVTRIDKRQEDSLFNAWRLMAREMFHELIRRCGTNEDRIYFAEKLDFYDLILTGSNEHPDPREESILIDLLIETKYKGNEVELIKKILRESNKLSAVSDKAIGLLSKQTDKIQSHHLNKFIHINNRYPKEITQQFIIENIGCERNHAAVKIRQSYLVKDIVRRLERMPKTFCEELLLKGISSEEKDRLIQESSGIFEKLLYLPISQFEKVSLKDVQLIHEESEDWNTESEGEETKPEKKKRGKKEKEEDKEEEEEEQEKEEIKLGKNKGPQCDFDESEEEHCIQVANENNSEFPSDPSEQSIDSEEDDCDRSSIVEMFIEQNRSKELQLYSKFMTAREQLDVLINSQYSELKPDSKYLDDKEIVAKIVQLVKLLNSMEAPVVNEIITRVPDALFSVLKKEGLMAEIDEEMRGRMEKRRKIVTKSPKWRLMLFSEREESDDSDAGERDEDEDDSEGEGYDSRDEDEEDEESESSEVIAYNRRPLKKLPSKQKSKPKEVPLMEEDLPLPGLLPTYSKIEEEISGTQLKRDQILKILEISVYWLLSLPESQIKTKQITSYYMDILQSNLGQIFFESCMTVMRFDETQNNLEWLVREAKKQGNLEIGLQEISMESATHNILYLIKEYQEMNEEKDSVSNILFKESTTLLPIAEKLITKLDLPIQNNCLTLLLVYIATRKGKIRSKISHLNYTISGNELPGGKTEYKLKYSEMVRIIDNICRYGNSNSIWEMIEEKMNLKVKEVTRLFGCMKGYGSHLYEKLLSTGEKILKTIKLSESQFGMHHEEQQSLHNLENTHHIVSKLVLSVKEKIKQFYFINKENLKKIMEEEVDDLYEEMEVLKKLPKKMKENKAKIFKNRELIDLVEVVVYFIKILKDQFHGKIEDKLFSKLVQYPKMILESTWYYIFIYSNEENYVWKTPSQIEEFFKAYPFIGSYKFSNLQEVFSLIVYFFNLEAFCTDKFKQFFLPILMKNERLSREITLRFKVPRIGEDEDYNPQSIVVNRKCSFDMAFYQVTGHAIQVEFHEEEGSDQGGLVRELMIGWKGRGVGEQAFFIGKILGISFKQGVPYGGDLDIGMFVAITNYSVPLEFFEQVDPEMYRSLKYIKDNDPEPLFLKFMVEHNQNGKLIEYQLIEDGRNVDLVEANKTKYLQTYTQKYFYLGRERELAELKLGFNTVVYPKYAEIFTPLEMMRQIKGEEIVDVKMLISKAKYEGYSAESSVIRWLWSIVQTFDQEKMNLFIQFVTGSPKITVYNSNFSINIEKVYEIECLPVAHTCFNTIDLPEYSSREVLEKKLLMAIFQGNSSFGIL